MGAGLVRALYATYVSYLPVEEFAYTVPQHGDPRGVFVEMLKTPDCGQFSYFTAHPGITRGGHYHHSKTEKFLVIKGQARFKFRHMQTGETYELLTSGEKAQIIVFVEAEAPSVFDLDRIPAKQAFNRWQRRLGAHNAALAFNAFQHGGFFAAHIAARALAHL